MKTPYHIGLAVPWSMCDGKIDMMEIELLCGASSNSGKYAWDPPEYFKLEPEQEKNFYKCPDCLNHPDYPLIMLAAV